MEIHVWDIALRILCAMLVGFSIGAGRERIHRPAGIRTHMVVAVGACVVMITGQLLYLFSGGVGAWSTPDRMAAQVISGIGFLGAGTIIREGLTIKGLTTAASLWSVACLGVAAGAGFYVLTLSGTLAVTVTLSLIRPWQDKRFFKSDGSRLVLKIDCVLLDAVMRSLEELAAAQAAEIRHLEVETVTGAGFRIRAALHLPDETARQQQMTAILETLRQVEPDIQIHASIV